MFQHYLLLNNSPTACLAHVSLRSLLFAHCLLLPSPLYSVVRPSLKLWQLHTCLVLHLPVLCEWKKGGEQWRVRVSEEQTNIRCCKNTARSVVFLHHCPCHLPSRHRGRVPDLHRLSMCISETYLWRPRPQLRSACGGGWMQPLHYGYGLWQRWRRWRQL